MRIYTAIERLQIIADAYEIVVRNFPKRADLEKDLAALQLAIHYLRVAEINTRGNAFPDEDQQQLVLNLPVPDVKPEPEVIECINTMDDTELNNDIVALRLMVGRGRYVDLCDACSLRIKLKLCEVKSDGNT